MVSGATYSLGHTNTGITDGKGLVDLVWDDVESQLLLGVELGWVGEGLIADLVESIGTVRDQLSKEDLLVGVDGVDDQAQELGDLSLELKSLGSHYCGYIRM